LNFDGPDSEPVREYFTANAACWIAVLDRARWLPVFDVVRSRLLTPVGLRSLAPGHRDYKPRYYGDLRARDAAYHQGFVGHLDEAGVGTLSEIFDADEPYTARGCIAQAWSVAEVLRAWLLTEGS